MDSIGYSILLFVFMFNNCYADECASAILISDVSKRGTACKGTHLTQMVCDRQLEYGWYFAKNGEEFLQMPTACPPMFSCGTAGGIWLNGTHPQVINTTVMINGCRRGLPTDTDECCAETIPIEVRHCGNFYAYRLPYTTTCDQAYCFGTNSCPLTTTTTSTTHSSSALETHVCQSAILIGDVSKRGTGCLGTKLTEMVCDRQLSEGWYYAQYEGKMLTMPTSCPSMLSCGTAGGIWLNGIHPQVINTTVTINGCRRGLRTDTDECCAETIPIEVRHCGNFYAYRLSYTTTCEQAYCFGNLNCQEPETTDRPEDVSPSSQLFPMMTDKPTDNGRTDKFGKIYKRENTSLIIIISVTVILSVLGFFVLLLVYFVRKSKYRLPRFMKKLLQSTEPSRNFETQVDQCKNSALPALSFICKKKDST